MSSLGAFRLLAAAVAVASLAGRGEAVTVTPVQKVIQMLDGMLAKGKEEKHAEEVAFAKFQEWCDGLNAEKTKAIADSGEEIERLGAEIETAASDASVLAGEIASLEGAVATADSEVKSATEIRSKENADYMAQHQDFSESIDAVTRAIQVLKARSADVPQALLQVKQASLVDARTKALVNSFLAARSDASQSAGAPEANAYESQSGGVLDILAKLRTKFEDQLLALEKAEMNSKANYEVLMQQLTDNIKADKGAISDKTSLKAGRMQDEAAAKADKSVEEAGKAEDSETLADTKAQCYAASEEFEKNQVLRKEEIETIEKAAAILSGPAVTGHAETYLPALLQKKGTALVQLVQTSRGAEEGRERAAAYLQGRAAALGSRYLEVIANHMQEDPFAKVKKMIKDMIVKLMEEANEEADHNSYCTSELAANKLTRENKASEAEALAAQSDELESEIAQLSDEISALSDAVAESRGQQAESSKVRAEEKAANAKTVADAKEAQDAVEQAITMLRDFYASAAGGAASLLQGAAKGRAASSGAAAQKANKAKAMAATGRRATAPYGGMQDSTGGVLGMLDVILSDFARLETETSLAEEQGDRAHEKFMAESTQDVAVKETTMKHKQEKKQDAQSSLLATKKQFDLTQSELSAAQDYYDKLKADCLDRGLTYDNRKQQREEEIQSLKEAVRLLNQQDLA
jgi:hypothetical protein